MGCVLLNTESDSGQILRSQDKSRFVQDFINDADRAAAILNNKNDPLFKAAVHYVLRNVAGNESIPDAYKEILPEAVATISKINSEILALAKPTRSQGHENTGSIPRGLVKTPDINSWEKIRKDGKPADRTGIDEKLEHKTQGSAFAAELIVTAAIIKCGSIAGNAKGCKGKLEIHKTDRLDMGIRLQASYKGAHDVIKQPERGTVEADSFIQRGKMNPRNIGIDVKHSKSSTYGSGKVEQEQLEGLVVAIQTGEIHEFHFVTNKRFGKGSYDLKKRIDEANAVIARTEAVHNWELETGINLDLDKRSPTVDEEKKIAEYIEKEPPCIFWHENVWMKPHGDE
jgi:hypothetical protein